MFLWNFRPKTEITRFMQSVYLPVNHIAYYVLFKPDQVEICRIRAKHQLYLYLLSHNVNFFFPFNVKRLFLNECNIFVNRYIFIKWFINISIDIDVCNKVSSIQSIFDFEFEGNRFETMKIHK